MAKAKDTRPLAERFVDPETGFKTRERVAELGDMIANYEPKLIPDMAKYEARIRKLYADLFG